MNGFYDSNNQPIAYCKPPSFLLGWAMGPNTFIARTTLILTTPIIPPQLTRYLYERYQKICLTAGSSKDHGHN